MLTKNIYMSAKNQTILSFKDVTFEHPDGKKILTDSNFSLRRGMKVVLLGQNGAGKTTMFKLIEGILEPTDGAINIHPKIKIAHAKQIFKQKELDLTVREYFDSLFEKKDYAIEPKIKKVLNAVNLVIHDTKPINDKKINEFSGGQQGRILLAGALIQNPDLLLLDEPTNNLDSEGIEHLINFLKKTKATCIVISHDSDFLERFSDGLLYLNSDTKKIEQYKGTYADVIEQVAKSVKNDQRKNSLLQKKIEQKKAMESKFANKGAGMRVVAKKMRKKIEELESEEIEVRKEDKTINKFNIIPKKDFSGKILEIEKLSIMTKDGVKSFKTDIFIKKDEHFLLSGPNGIGKTTLLNKLATQQEGLKLEKGVRIGYYSQDFSVLDYNQTIHESLEEVMVDGNEETLRKVASGFLINNEMINRKIEHLSEGQKGLVSFARLVLQKPEFLILDEPTNHINYRHLPVIAKALADYKGAFLLVSHNKDFIKQVRIDDEIQLDNIKKYKRKT